MRLYLRHAAYGIALLLALLNVWASIWFSPSFVLKAYLVGLVGCMQGLAAAILIAGVVVPPVMLAFYLWEAATASGPSEEGD